MYVLKKENDCEDLDYHCLFSPFAPPHLTIPLPLPLDHSSAPPTGSSATYLPPLLADGLGTKVHWYSDAEQMHRERISKELVVYY